MEREIISDKNKMDPKSVPEKKSGDIKNHQADNVGFGEAKEGEKKNDWGILDKCASGSGPHSSAAFKDSPDAEEDPSGFDRESWEFVMSRTVPPVDITETLMQGYEACIGNFQGHQLSIQKKEVVNTKCPTENEGSGANDKQRASEMEEKPK